MHRGSLDIARWMLQRLRRRLTGRVPSEPDPASFRRAAPRIAYPHAPVHRFTATWVGHSTFLLQIGGLNILTDPMWGERASPVGFAGPRRWVPSVPPLDALPTIDIVLQSHNHYDHLDRGTVAALADRHSTTRWVAPLGVGGILRRFGVRDVIELDWWDSAVIDGAVIGCTPARHFSARGVRDRNATLWCGWAIAAAGRRSFFAGDTGLHPEFARIAERFGPFDLTMLPIGAYEPRWFMAPVHIAPHEVIRAYTAMRDTAPSHRSLMAGMHWGTFKLTDEAMDEPPQKTRDEWTRAGLPPDELWIPAHGESRVICE